MLRYIIRRCLGALLVVLIISMATFRDLLPGPEAHRF